MPTLDRPPLLRLHLKNYLRDSFDTAEQWNDLGALFGFSDLVDRHDRLLRSLRFGDDDYGSSIADVLQQATARDPDIFERLAEHLNLGEHLRQTDKSAYQQLYGGASAALSVVRTSGLNSAIDVNQAVTRIQRALHDDPEQALGSAKELVETVVKKILVDHGETSVNDDLPKLIKRVQQKLNLDPGTVAPSMPGVDAIRMMLSGLGQILHGLGELRNLYGTGHGKTGPTGLEERHAQLAVTAAGAAASFLMETHLLQKQRAGSRGSSS